MSLPQHQDAAEQVEIGLLDRLIVGGGKPGAAAQAEGKEALAARAARKLRRFIGMDLAPCGRNEAESPARPAHGNPGPMLQYLKLTRAQNVRPGSFTAVLAA